MSNTGYSRFKKPVQPVELKLKPEITTSTKSSSTIKPKPKPKPVKTKLNTSNWEKSSLDSLNLYNKWNVPLKPGEAKRPLTQEEKKFYKDEKTGISPISMTYKISSPNVWGYAGNFQKPAGVQKKVETIKEPVKTQAVNKPNPIDKDRT